MIRSLLRMTLCRRMASSVPANDPRGTEKKIRVYTKTGDKGTSSLFNMERRSKSDDHFQALGDVDELNAHVG